MEGDEESGSGDMDYYLERLKKRLGENIKMIWIVDSGACDYERMWITESLRGCLIMNMKIEVSKEGLHSGDASGIIPEPFRIGRMLLKRIEDTKTGRMHPSYYSEIPS